MKKKNMEFCTPEYMHSVKMYGWKTETTFTHTLRHVECSSHTLTLCPHSPITKSLSIMALICVHLTCLSLNIHQQSFIIQFLVFFPFYFLWYFSSSLSSSSSSYFCCCPTHFHIQHTRNAFVIRAHFQYSVAIRFENFNTYTNWVKRMRLDGGLMLIVCLLKIKKK